jgi:1-phosphofructokinase
VIATVTLNPAIDKSLSVPGFQVGKTNRGEVNQTDAGGKGINVAKAVKRLGGEVCALGFMGESNGRFILEALAASEIPADFCMVPGETRVNLKIQDPLYGTETELNEPGFKVLPEHLQAIKQKVKEYGPRCEVLVFSGSLPPGAPPETFAELITVARSSGAKCMLDTAGQALRLGLGAKPFIIKPNQAEVEELLQVRLGVRRELVEAARKLLEMGSKEVVISLGADGAVAATAQDLLSARPPAVAPRSSVGAGDAMLAALAYAEVKHLSFRESFRLAIAASAAAVTMEGSNVADVTLIQSLIPQVQMEDVVSP